MLGADEGLAAARGHGRHAQGLPDGLTAFGDLPGRFLPPLILVPGASASQEQKCWAEGKAEKSGPISEAITSAVPGPTVGIAVRSTPIIPRNARAWMPSLPV